jgi:hypothetical protein
MSKTYAKMPLPKHLKELFPGATTIGEAKKQTRGLKEALRKLNKRIRDRQKEDKALND